MTETAVLILLYSYYLEEAFDKNYFLNSRDNVGCVQCMVGAVNESKHDRSVGHDLQFDFFAFRNPTTLY